jgi:hypothetical protein
MYYIGLDVHKNHKKTISYCVKDASGQVHQEGQIGATRRELDSWMKTLPQPWTVAMEATIFTGWPLCRSPRFGSSSIRPVQWPAVLADDTVLLQLISVTELSCYKTAILCTAT